MDAPPQSVPLPEVTIEAVPDRPDDFKPLGSGGNSVDEELWRELKSQAELTHTADKPEGENGFTPSRTSGELAEASHMSHWNEDRGLRTEQSCISAN